MIRETKNELSHVRDALVSYREFLEFKTHLSDQRWVIAPREKLVDEALLHLEILEGYIKDIEETT